MPVNKRLDYRMVKRHVPARTVKRPSQLDLDRRDQGVSPTEGLTAAVMAALTLGQPAEAVALRFGLSVTTVKRWEKAYDISNPVKRRDHLSELIMSFIEQEIASLMTISMVTQDDEWIKQQKAAELAEYIATKEDRVMGMLAAYSKAQASKAELVQTKQIEVVDEQRD